METKKRKLSHYERRRIVHSTKRKAPFHIKCRRELRRLAYSIYPKICMKCGSENDLQIDHIYPVSVYPDLEFLLENTQVLCKRCNYAKSNHYFKDYRTPRQKQLAKDLFDSLDANHIVKKKFNKNYLRKIDLYTIRQKEKFNDKKTENKNKISHKPKVILRKKAAAPLACGSYASTSLVKQG